MTDELWRLDATELARLIRLGRVSSGEAVRQPCAAAIPREPIIIVVNALANLLLNIEPSHAMTPWFGRTS